MLPDSDKVVMALRLRISRLVGYPESALEPLQGVRYQPGQFYKPHHDYYNSCETWLDGNRHFTFLVYLNHVEGGGGQTGETLSLHATFLIWQAFLIWRDASTPRHPPTTPSRQGFSSTVASPRLIATEYR